MDSLEIKNIVTQLLGKCTREEGFLLLKEEDLNRVELVEVARYMDIPWNVNNEKLRASIIENTIGFRLRSRAIQGK